MSHLGQAQELDKLVPQEQLTVIASRPELASRSANAQEPSLLWHLQGYGATLAAGGDLDGANALNRKTDCCKSRGQLQETKGLR